MLKRKAQAGFTMIELVIVMAIIAILATLVYPGYLEQVRRAGRTDARNLMVEIAAQQERFRYGNPGYAASMTALGRPSTTATSENGKYIVSMTTANNAAGNTISFVLTAVPQPGQDKDKCRTLTLTHNGVKGATGNGSDYVVNDPRCWQ